MKRCAPVDESALQHFTRKNGDIGGHCCGGLGMALRGWNGSLDWSTSGPGGDLSVSRVRLAGYPVVRQRRPVLPIECLTVVLSRPTCAHQTKAVLLPEGRNCLPPEHAIYVKSSRACLFSARAPWAITSRAIIMPSWLGCLGSKRKPSMASKETSCAPARRLRSISSARRTQINVQPGRQAGGIISLE